jgi:hypothetical protein
MSSPLPTEPHTASSAELDLERVGDAAAAISTMAWTHGITAAPAPIDAFADAAARLSDAEVTFDHIERLLLGLARANLVTDEQRFALHAAYLHQKADGVRPVR